MVLRGSRKKDMVDFMRLWSQTQLEHDRLLGFIPVRSRRVWCGRDAGLKGKHITVWGAAPLSLAPGHLGSHLKNNRAEILHYFNEFVDK